MQEEEKIAEKIQQFPCLYDKSNEGYKEKDREKNAWRECSLLNEITNIYIAFKNVIFVKFGGSLRLKTLIL